MLLDACRGLRLGCRGCEWRWLCRPDSWRADGRLHRRHSAGESYVIYGGRRDALGDLDLANLEQDQGFIAVGAAEFDLTGYSVSTAGDINGDGFDDLLVGAPGAGDGANLEGTVYVIYGGATGTEDTVSVQQTRHRRGGQFHRQCG